MPRQLEKPPVDKEKDIKSPGNIVFLFRGLKLIKVLKIPEKPSIDKEKDLKSPSKILICLKN